MSQFLDRLTFFTKVSQPFSDGHGIMTNEDRRWEDGYRKRWQHDKVVRSTHGANCTGSCSWKIYVKGGIVTWETQQTDYPRTRPDLPNHEPRGCSRGASYSWYLYSGNRVKYPLIRSRLIKLWREARKTLAPVAAWKSIVENPSKRQDYMSVRGHGGFVRAISLCSAACACLSTIGIAIFRPHPRRHGVSKQTFRKAPTGITPASLFCGVRMSRRPAHPMRISIPKRAIVEQKAL